MLCMEGKGDEQEHSDTWWLACVEQKEEAKAAVCGEHKNGDRRLKGGFTRHGIWWQNPDPGKPRSDIAIR
jgi:hypothetical protein